MAIAGGLRMQAYDISDILWLAVTRWTYQERCQGEDLPGFAIPEMWLAAANTQRSLVGSSACYDRLDYCHTRTL